MSFDLEGALAAARQSPNQGGSAPAKSEPMVWMGTFGPGRVVDETAGGVFRRDGGISPGGIPIHGTVATKKNQDDVRTVEQAYGQIYQWNDKQRKTWSDLLISKGIVEQGDYSFDTAEKWWQYAVEKSANMFAAGKKVAPQQFISRYAMGDQAGAANGPGGSGQPKTTTSTSTEEKVFTDPVEARYVIRKTLENELHRAPTEKELRRFQDLLHRQEDEPAASTTTQTTDGKGNTTYSTSHQDDTSPVSPEAVADEFARSGKVGRERNTTKAGIDMYAAVMKALGAGGGFA